MLTRRQMPAQTAFIMKRIIILTLAVVGCICIAGTNEQPNKLESYFAFPRAVISMNGPDEQVISDCSSCIIRSHSQPEPRFSDGHKFKDGTWAKWELVRKTEYGDVYLIVVERPSITVTVTPVLFGGKTQTVFLTTNLTINILPEHPKRK